MNKQFDTWLNEDDIMRLWNITQGILPNVAATSNEMDEFLKLVNHSAMLKMGGDGYDTSTLQ